MLAVIFFYVNRHAIKPSNPITKVLDLTHCTLELNVPPHENRNSLVVLVLFSRPGQSQTLLYKLCCH